MQLTWNDKPYYSLNHYLKKTYGQKVYKLALNGSMTCPNRDGTLGTGGCIFCSEGGSGDFASDSALTITEQIECGKKRISNKQRTASYIAYFQAYTNTYASVDYLRSIFTEAAIHPDVKIISIATRPDCLSEEIVLLLKEINLLKPVWIEFGLQTMHDTTAHFIRRGYSLSVFEHALKHLNQVSIPVIVHTILYLPLETDAMILETMDYLNTLPIQGIKLQLLHVLKHTDLAVYFREHPFYIPEMHDYFHLLGACICKLRPDIVIHRLTGDGPKSLLMAPLWSGNKRQVMNCMHAYFKQHNIWQGRSYSDVGTFHSL